MPCLKVLTNIPKSKIPKDFFSKIIPVLAEGVRKKPEQFLCALEGDCLLSINGNTELPAAIATLESIGNLGPEENKRIVNLLSSFLQKEIGVQPDRFFLTFYDLENYNVAKNGVTIASNYLNRKDYVLTEDGAPCHRTQKTTAWKSEKGLTILPWPGQSPNKKGPNRECLAYFTNEYITYNELQKDQ